MKPSGRKLTCCLLACALTSVLALFALEWPVAGGVPSIPFGSFRSGRFITASWMAPGNVPVTAAAPGDVFFMFDGDKLPSGLPCSLGGFVAVEHSDGLVGVYGRLEEGSLPIYPRRVDQGDMLGRAGAAGFFSSREASFLLYDRIKRQSLNPQVLLPPVRDDRAPQVRGVYMVSGERLLPLAETRHLRQGTYEVVADLQDPLVPSDSRARACYFIRLLIDGTERLRYQYDAARVEQGRLVFFGAARADEESYFLPDGKVRLGSYLFPRGRSTIVLIVSDYSGNEREATFTVSFD